MAGAGEARMLGEARRQRILEWMQEEGSARVRSLAEAFSGKTGLSVEQRFAQARWDTIASGAPTLVGAMAVFDCELFESKDMATHRVLFGKVTGLRIGDSLDPLLYHNRGYRVL